MTPAKLALGRYQLQHQIAAGGMGEVWRGVDTVLERPVAVKMLRGEHACQAEAVARFRSEARHAGAFSPRTGATSPTLAEIPLPGARSDRPRTWSARGHRAGLLLAVAAAVALAGLLGMLIAGTPTTTRPAPPPSQLAARVAEVNTASFIGEPVSLAVRQLRQLGLVVRVDWQQTGLAPAGTVVSVRPGGQASLGSTVTLTGALPPPQVAGENHDGGISGNDTGGSDGGGGGGGHGGGSGSS